MSDEPLPCPGATEKPAPAKEPWIAISPRAEQAIIRFAPVFFILFALFRNFLETARMGARSSYSYYTTLHHLSWYTSATLLIILVVHFVLRVHLRRLVWMLYGVTALGVPILYALVLDVPLRLEYLRGTPLQVLTHTVTFCLTFKRNWPLAVEVVLIFIGMFVIGYFYSRSWVRALLTAAAAHVTLAIVGMSWFGIRPSKFPILQFDTTLTRLQPLLAVCWGHVATALLLVFLWRLGGLGPSLRPWIWPAIAAVWMWVGYSATVLLTGWFSFSFDAIATALPLVTVTLLLTRVLRRDRGLVRRSSWALLALLLVAQLLIIAPIATHQEERFLRQTRRMFPLGNRRPAAGQATRPGRPTGPPAVIRPVPQPTAPPAGASEP